MSGFGVWLGALGTEGTPFCKCHVEYALTGKELLQKLNAWKTGGDVESGGESPCWQWCCGVGQDLTWCGSGVWGSQGHRRGG